MARGPNRYFGEEMRNLRGKTPILFRGITNSLMRPSLNQVQSAGGSPQWISRMCPRLRTPFPTFTFLKTKDLFKKSQNVAEYELKVLELFLNVPRFIKPRTFVGTRLKIDIYADACQKSPFGKALSTGNQVLASRGY